MNKLLTDEQILTIYGWDITESEDGSGDTFAYWDHENGETPNWANWATSCECVESLIESFKKSSDYKLLQAQLDKITEVVEGAGTTWQDYSWPKTTQNKEEMSRYQTGKITKEEHGDQRTVVFDEEFAIYKKSEMDTKRAIQKAIGSE